MLGRHQVPGCCPGTKAGRGPGLDCSGGGSMGARAAKRAEQREMDAEIAAGTLEWAEAALPLAAEVWPEYGP